MAYDYSGMASNYKKRFGPDSSLGRMARQGFTGRGFTGSPENIAMLTGEDYTNQRTGDVTSNIGGPTWQEVDAGADPYDRVGVTPGYDRAAVTLGAGSDVDTGGVPGAISRATDLSGVYSNQLGREPDQAGMDFYQQKIDSGEMTFEEARQQIIKSDEGRGYNTPREQYINDWYQKEFGRDADPEGMDFYLDNPDQLPGLGGVLDYSPEAVEGGTSERYGGSLDDRQYAPENSLLSPEEQNRRSMGNELAAREGLEVGEEYLKTGYEETLEAYNPYDAATGALGPEAQQKFYDEYEMSPGQQYLLEQQQEALHRRRNALGKSMGGGTQIALQRDAAGFAMQDMSDYLGRLEGSTGRRGDVMTRRGETLADINWQTQQSISQQRAQFIRDYGQQAGKLGMTAAELDSQYGADIEKLINSGIVTRQEIVDAMGSGTAEDFDNYMDRWMTQAADRTKGAAEIELSRGTTSEGQVKDYSGTKDAFLSGISGFF